MGQSSPTTYGMNPAPAAVKNLTPKPKQPPPHLDSNSNVNSFGPPAVTSAVNSLASL